MANRFLLALLVGCMVAGIGCGDFNDESLLRPTPTQGPPTPTPLPICQGLTIPPGLGCRPFTFTQPQSSNTSGTQLFTSLSIQGEGNIDFLPALLENGIDPGGNFDELPPGFALLAGIPDADGVATVEIGVTPENQLIPGHVVIGVKPILDYICFKLDLSTVDARLYCNGSATQGLDTRVTAGAGVTPSRDDVIELRIGDSAPPGSLFIEVDQQQGRIEQGSDPRYETCRDLPECAEGERFNCYRPTQRVGFTTTTVFGMKGIVPLLNADGEPGFSGEPFDCNAWTQADGPGQIVQGVVDFDAAGGNVATALRIDD